MLRVPVTDPAAQPQADLAGLAPEIRNTLAALAEVETRYESDRECLAGWIGPEAARKRLLDLLEARHRREREPLVQQLAELHQSRIMASMFQNWSVRR